MREIYKHFKSIKKLTAEEELDLFAAYKEMGSQRAYEDLIKAHLRLAAHMADRFAGHSGGLYDDYFQVGVEGIIYAINKFDYKRGTRFCAYADHWVRYYAQVYYRRTFSAGPMCMTNSKVKQTFVSEKRDVEISPDHVDASQSPEEIASANSQRSFLSRAIGEALETLEPQERDLISARYLGEEQGSISEVRKITRLTPAKMREVEESAKAKIRQQLIDQKEELLA